MNLTSRTCRNHSLRSLSAAQLSVSCQRGIMNQKRKSIGDTIEASVLVRSRRRCCICYGLNRDLGIKKGQIAHIDQNRGNNKPENLVFLCINHHDEYDSRTSQSKGIQRKELESYRTELDEYFSTWSEEHLGDESDLQDRVLLEISLIPHNWKNALIMLNEYKLQRETNKIKSEYVDIWDRLLNEFQLEYSEAEWSKYSLLFSNVMKSVKESLEKTVMMYKEYIPVPLKLSILKSISQLETECRAYRAMRLLVLNEDSTTSNSIFNGRFKSTLIVLSELSKLAEKARA